MIEHGAATLPRAGSGRAVDLLMMPERGVFGLAVGSGSTGAWAAQRCLGTLRERSQELAELAEEIEAGAGRGPELLALMQDAFDHATWVLQEETANVGVPTQAELTAIVAAGSSVWLGVCGNCVLMCSKGEAQDIRSVPLGVLPRSQPELLLQSLSPRETLVLSSTALSGELRAEVEPRELARILAGGLGGKGEQAVLVLRAGEGGTTSDILEQVGRTRLFGKLDPGGLARLRPYLLERHVSGGKAVFSEGDAGERLYLVLSGELEVTRRGVSLTKLGPGQHFGELALHLAGRRTATVTALTDCWLVSLHRRHLRELSERRPEVAAGLLRVLLRDVAERLRDLTERVSE